MGVAAELANKTFSVHASYKKVVTIANEAVLAIIEELGNSHKRKHIYFLVKIGPKLVSML